MSLLATRVGRSWRATSHRLSTADILTGGRVIFGVGRGYHTREVETFGSPLLDQPANRELFEEQVDIIFKAFNERAFSHQGKYYTLPPRVPYRGYELTDLTLVPQPVTKPVQCWQPIVSASPRGLDFMARRLLSRPFAAAETKVVRASLDDLLAFYKGHPEDAKQLLAVGESKADTLLDAATLAAWTMVANELMNLDEVLNK